MRDDDRDTTEPGSDPASPGERPPAGEDDVDEELMALAAPPPSLRQAIFIALILCLSVFMLVWFFPNLKFFLGVFGEPEDLGEAADLRAEKLETDAYVRLHGLPMITRSLEFKKGVRWFSDTTRKVFPVTGRSDLLVEWTMPDEAKAYRDPEVNPISSRLPYDFAGRLVARDELGANYEKIWRFYDCLELYSVRECKVCLGAPDFETCRRRFACLGLFGPEKCRGVLDDEGHARRAELERRVDELALDELERAHRMLVEGLEELEAERERIRVKRSDLASGRLVERLEARAVEERRRLREGEARLERLRAKLAEAGLDEDRLRAEAERDDRQLNLVQSRIRDITRRADEARATVETLEPLSGEELERALAELEAETRERLDALREAAKPATGPDAGPDAGSDAGPDAASPREKHARRIAELEADLEAIGAGRLVERRREQIEAFRDRLREARERRDALRQELDAAREKLGELNDLPRLSRQRTEKVAQLEREIEAAGSGELRARLEREAAIVSRQLARFEGERARLERLGEAIARLEPGDARVAELREEVAKLRRATGSGQWLLVDGDVPIDSIWVLAVYLIFSIMVSSNVQHLVRFWRAWRA